MSRTQQSLETVRASSVAELAWLDSPGSPAVRGVVGLVRGGCPVVTFTYAEQALARAVAASPTVVLTCTEPRSTGSGFTPVAVTGRPRLVEDPSGSVFLDDLLSQELRKYPPSRLYVDSPLLRREHWWYLPRLIVEIDVDTVQPCTARSAPDEDHLLVTATDGAPVVHLTRVSEQGTLDVSGAAAGSAVLFGQDASFPDLEQWSQWCYHGFWDGSRFEVTQMPDAVGLAPTPTLRQRWRRQRDLEKRCRAALPGR